MPGWVDVTMCVQPTHQQANVQRSDYDITLQWWLAVKNHVKPIFYVFTITLPCTKAIKTNTNIHNRRNTGECLQMSHTNGINILKAILYTSS